MRQEGRFFIRISYDFKKPGEKPFVPENAVYVALGSWDLGVVSPKGEALIPLGRPDVHWKPDIEEVTVCRDRCVEGSRNWHKRNCARQKKYRKLRLQQKQGRRETAALDLLRHGVHFVISDLVVRSKKGKLADASKPERRGTFGANASAQNTGAIAALVQALDSKAKENGGSVRKHRLPRKLVPPGRGHENKIPMARALRDDFLRSSKKAE